MAALRNGLVLLIIKALSCLAVKNPLPKLVQWQELPSGYVNEIFRIYEPGSVLEWYANSPNLSIVFLNDPVEVRLKMICKFQHFDDPTKLRTGVQFEGPDIVFYNDQPKQKRQKFPGFDSMVQYDKKTGIILSGTIPKNERIHFTPKHCYVESKKGIRYSNNLYLIDNRRFFDFKVKKVTSPKMSEIVADEPVTIPCREVKAQLFRPFIYEWFTVENGKTVESLREIGEKLSWPVQILADGAVYWPYLNQKVVEKLKSKKLLCKVEGIDAVETKLPLTVKSGGDDAKKVKSLEMIETSDPVKVIPRSLQPPVLNCRFKVGRGPYEVKWKLGDRALKQGQNERGVVVSGSQLRLVDSRFGLLKDQESTNFNCIVTWTPSGKSKQVKTSKITVLSYPVPIVSFQPLKSLYAMEGDNVTYTLPVIENSRFRYVVHVCNTVFKVFSHKLLDEGGYKKQVKKNCHVDFKNIKLSTYPNDIEGYDLTGIRNSFIVNGIKSPDDKRMYMLFQCQINGPGFEFPNLYLPPESTGKNEFVVMSAMTLLSGISRPVVNAIQPADCSGCDFCDPQNLSITVVNAAEFNYTGLKLLYAWFVLNRDKKTWKKIAEYNNSFVVSEGGNSLLVKDLETLDGVSVKYGKLDSSLSLACRVKVQNTLTGREWEGAGSYEELAGNSMPLKGAYTCQPAGAWWIWLVVGGVVLLLVLLLAFFIVAACCGWCTSCCLVACLRRHSCCRDHGPDKVRDPQESLPMCDEGGKTAHV